jgi:hypothetical protein
MVGNDAINYFDLYGLTESGYFSGLKYVTVSSSIMSQTDIEGMSWTDGALSGSKGALTAPSFSLECDCEEDSEDSTISPECELTLSVSITLDVAKLNNNNSSLNRSYGHEQRHVLNVMNKASSLMSDLDKALAGLECKDLNTCKQDIEIERLKTRVAWLEFKSDEAAHKTGNPAAGLGYEPLNDVFPEPTKSN